MVDFITVLILDKEAELSGVFCIESRAVIHIAGIQSLDFTPQLLTTHYTVFVSAHWLD